jgi:ArsR family transcriptional regulator
MTPSMKNLMTTPMNRTVNSSTNSPIKTAIKRVLFLCTANSVRSQMAEALLRFHAGDQFQVMSAGTAPADIDPRTLQVLTENRIPAENLQAKSIDSLRHQHFDFVISLCSNARQECQNWPGAGVVIAWDFPDPQESLDPHAFTKTFHAIDQRIQLFVEVNRPMGDPLSISLSPVEFYKSLADEIRLKSLLLIQQQGELCVCELMAALEETQPKISRNLALLRKSGLLLDRRQKQWVFYRLHPLMHAWMRDVLRTTQAGNPALIEPEMRRLVQMQERPSECLSA